MDGAARPARSPPMRSFLVLLMLVAQAAADEPVDLAKRLEALAAAAPGEPRLAAAKAVIAAGPTAIPALVAALKEKRASTPDQLRGLLRGIRAEVPNTKGTFEQPPRPKD